MTRTLPILLLAAFMAGSQAELPKLTVHGKNLVNPSGKVVTLRGVNVGNWLILEMWMFGWAGDRGLEYTDQYDFENILAKRFGRGEADRLMDVYRDSWMTDRDWAKIKSFGMNLVRLPFNYRLLEDDENPYHLKKNAWKYLDRAVNEAEKHGIYTILDLHGVQGGQTPNDHTGRRDQNKLWTVEENKKRAAWLWSQIASRYKNRNAVVAYDVFNEPYGGTKPQQLEVFEKLYAGVRKTDPEKLVFAHGNSDNFDHYGNPKDHGWHNVGLQMHYYPGIFGGARDMNEQARHFIHAKLVAKQIDALQVPMLVGEFNVLFSSMGGAGTLARHIDTYSQYGWMSTVWSYKVMGDGGPVGDGSWGLVTNGGKPPMIDIRKESKEDIEKGFRGYATMELQEYTSLKNFLLAKNPKYPELPKLPEPIAEAPSHDEISGWTSSDIGGSLAGGLVGTNANKFELYGGGEDIWGTRDQFGFLHQEADGDFQVSVTIDSMEDTDTYAKAGLMVRDGMSSEAPFALLSVFPGGTVQFAGRESAGAEGKAKSEGEDMKFPIHMRLVRRGDHVDAFVQGTDGNWKARGSTKIGSGKVQVGVVALSHDNKRLTKVAYRNLVVAPAP